MSNMQTYAWTAMGMRESTIAPTLFVKEHEIPTAMIPSLEDKLAAVVNYMTETRSGRMSIDMMALSSYLDDPEVASWLDNMNKNGRIRNTRFLFSHKQPVEK